jgi:hypothetical protein
LSTFYQSSVKLNQQEMSILVVMLLTKSLSIAEQVVQWPKEAIDETNDLFFDVCFAPHSVSARMHRQAGGKRKHLQQFEGQSIPPSLAPNRGESGGR